MKQFILLSLIFMLSAQAQVLRVTDSLSVYASEGVTKSLDEKELFITTFKGGMLHHFNLETGRTGVVLMGARFEGFDYHEHRFNGITNVGNDDLIVASSKFRNGALIYLKRIEDSRLGDPRFDAKIIVTGAGMPNDVEYTPNTDMLITSDMNGKRILKFSLKRLLARATPQEVHEGHVMLKTEGMVNGMQFLTDRIIMFITTGPKVETSGVVTYSYLSKYFIGKDRVNVIHTKEDAWYDGMLFDKESRRLYLSDNKNSEIDMFDLSQWKMTPLPTQKIAASPGQHHGLAEMVRVGNKIYVTDLWSAETSTLLQRSIYNKVGLYGDSVINWNESVLELEIDESALHNGH